MNTENIILYPIILFLFAGLSLNAQKNIIIDISKKDKIALSQIADTAWVIPLEINKEYDINKITDGVILTKNYVFVKKRSETDPAFIIKSLLQFDFKGNFIRQIGVINEETGKYQRIHHIQYLENRDEIYIGYKNGHAFFDVSGNLKRFIPANNLRFQKLFNNRLWEIERAYNLEEGKIIYSLVSTNLKGEDRNISYSFSRNMLKKGNYFEQVGDLGVYSFTSKGLIIFVHDLILNVSKENRVVPLYKFDYANDVHQPFMYRFMIHPNRFICNNWGGYGYFTTQVGTGFIYLFNNEKKISYNIPLLYKNNEGQLSSIKDDFFNTGYVLLKNSELNGYCYFIKDKELLNDIISRPEKWSNRIIVIVKMKK